MKNFRDLVTVYLLTGALMVAMLGALYLLALVEAYLMG